eukprot:6437354-Pyramimonas_sp.AAC.1
MRQKGPPPVCLAVQAAGGASIAGPCNGALYTQPYEKYSRAPPAQRRPTKNCLTRAPSKDCAAQGLGGLLAPQISA